MSNNYSGKDLAFLGDAVLDLLVRKKLLDMGETDVGKLTNKKKVFVNAKSQSIAVEKLLPYLTEEELDIFKRGRNANGVSAPKSCTTIEYRRATGLEALFGYLYLEEKTDRIEELFSYAYEEVEK